MQPQTSNKVINTGPYDVDPVDEAITRGFGRRFAAVKGLAFALLLVGVAVTAVTLSSSGPPAWQQPANAAERP